MSKAKMFLRDGLVFVMVLVGLYFLTTGTNMIKGEAVDPISDFSLDRQMADRLLAKKRYAEALPFFKRLTEQDRYNGYAWYWLGHCSFQVAENQRNRLDGLAESDPDYQRELNTYDGNINQAAMAYQQVLGYPRLRNRARYNLAIIHATVDDLQKTLQYLRDAVDDGYYTRRGLRKYSRFERLKDNAEFISICRQEHRNYMQNVNTSGRPRIAF